MAIPVFAILGYGMTVLKYMGRFFKMYTAMKDWVQEAQSVHGTVGGHKKLELVTGKAVDWWEGQYGEVDDNLEGAIVWFTAWAVDIWLDYYHGKKPEVFPNAKPLVEETPVVAPPVSSAADGS